MPVGSLRPCGIDPVTADRQHQFGRPRTTIEAAGFDIPYGCIASRVLMSAGKDVTSHHENAFHVTASRISLGHDVSHRHNSGLHMLGIWHNKRGLNNCADDACECAQDAGLRDRATRRPALQPEARPSTCKIPSTGAHFNRNEHTVQRELRRS